MLKKDKFDAINNRNNNPEEETKEEADEAEGTANAAAGQAPRKREVKGFLKGYQNQQNNANTGGSKTSGKSQQQQPLIKTTIQRPVQQAKAEEEEIDMTKLQIWSWNVNGIRAIIKKNRIQEFFERAKPLILCI